MLDVKASGQQDSCVYLEASYFRKIVDSCRHFERKMTRLGKVWKTMGISEQYTISKVARFSKYKYKKSSKIRIK